MFTTVMFASRLAFLLLPCEREDWVDFAERADTTDLVDLRDPLVDTDTWSSLLSHEGQTCITCVIVVND